MKALTALITAAMLCLGSGCGEGWFEAGEVRDPCTGEVAGELIDEVTVVLEDGSQRPLSEVLAADGCAAVGSREQAMTKAELNELIKELKPPPSK